MAVSRVQGGTADTTGTSTTIMLTFSSGNLIIASSRSGNGDAVTGISFSDAHNTWTNQDTKGDTGGAGGDTFGDGFAPNSASGTYAVTLSSTGNGTSSLRGTVEEFSGCSTSSPFEDHNTANASNNAGPSTVTTLGTSTAQNDLVWCAVNVATAQTLTAQDTQGSVLPAAPSSRIMTEWRAASAGGAQTSKFTFGAASNYATGIMTFAQSGAAPPTANPPPQRTMRMAGI